MRTQKKRSNPRLRLFRKYTKKNYLTYSQIKRLIQREFKLVYNSHIMTAFMAIWGTTLQNQRVITKSTFVTRLFRKPDGFFRDFHV